MATIQEINSSIMFGNLTNEQLDSVISAVKFRKSQILKENKNRLTIGSNVKFYSTKRNCSYQGKVTKIATKFITVSTSNGMWRVPGNMLEIV